MRNWNYKFTGDKSVHQYDITCQEHILSLHGPIYLINTGMYFGMQ